jgi:alpha-methylacyl-CoA racemase
MSGTLSGIKVIEIGSLGAAPFAAMVLADHGADVLRVERPDKAPLPGAEVHAELVEWDILSRGRRSAAIDLRHPEGVQLVTSLAGSADVLIEGLRPGVMERLGLGPDELCAANPRLVYGRMTGWGRVGPRSQQVGHDINYIGLAGVLAHIGRAGQPPAVPLNLAGDFGGGGLLLAFGVCAALVERSVSGRGQVVDAAMVDGAALLMAPLFGAHGSGFWSDERGTNLLDSGAPFYDCYECSDGRYVAVGAIEERFFEALLAGLGLGDDPSVPDQHDQASWPELRRRLAERFVTRPRDVWATTFGELDACVTPVLTMGEAPDDPHLAAWGTFIAPGGTRQPAPAPRFSRTPPGDPSPPQVAGGNTDEVLADWGVAEHEVRRLRDLGAVR